MQAVCFLSPKIFWRRALTNSGRLFILYILYIYSIPGLSAADPELNTMRCTMDIILTNSDRTPIYEQIVRQLKGLILSGQLREGEALPSMRLLARDLRISVITTKRAYEELEREGFLITVPGKGCFVAAQNRETRREAVLCQVEEHLSQAVDAAKAGAVELEELIEMLNTLYCED